MATDYPQEVLAMAFGQGPQSPLKHHGQDTYFTPSYIMPPNDHLGPIDTQQVYAMGHPMTFHNQHFAWPSVDQYNMHWSQRQPELGPPRSYTIDTDTSSSLESYSERPSVEPFCGMNTMSSPFMSGHGYASPTPTHVSIGAGCPGVTPQDIQHIPDSMVEPAAHLDMREATEIQHSPVHTYAASPCTMDTGLQTPLSEPATNPVSMEPSQQPEEEIEVEDNSGDYSPVTKRARNRKTKASSPKASSPSKGRSKTHRVSKSVSKSSTASGLLSPTASHKELSATQCPTCGQEQSSKNALTRHIQANHAAKRPFACIFDIYGCTATFGAKNEWKRHCSTQHLRLSFFRCDVGACVPQNAAPATLQPGWDVPVASSTVSGHNDFNRKDLFIQHHRRMHVPDSASIDNMTPRDKERFKASCETAARRCRVSARKPPEGTICGHCQSNGSHVVFEGANAWETRMEHVGRHLERAQGEPMHWNEDLTLRAWLVDEGLLQKDPAGNWRLTDVLKAEEAKPGRQR